MSEVPGPSEDDLNKNTHPLSRPFESTDKFIEQTIPGAEIVTEESAEEQQRLRNEGIAARQEWEDRMQSRMDKRGSGSDIKTGELSETD